MSSVKISVIVAVYNIESYIDQCVESILNQNYENVEIILVNDGSTDGSLQKLELWSKKSATIKIVDKKNAGLSSARNEGLKYVTGDYVIYVDGDDWLASGLCSKINDFIETNGLVDILCYSYSLYYNENMQKIEKFNVDSKVYTGCDFFEKSKFHVQAWNKAFRKKYLDEMDLKFLEGRLHEDVSYTIPLCMCSSKVAAISDVGYYYRQNRSGSIMAMIKEKNITDFSNALSFGYDFIKEHQALSKAYMQWLLHAIFRGGFSYRTSYKILKRNLIAVDAPKIVNEIVNQLGTRDVLKYKNNFTATLFINHVILRFRYLVGRIIHYRRYNA